MTNPAEVITVTLGDKTFRAGRRTAAHIEWTIKRLAAEHPGCHFHVIQPCYNTGVSASEGTHDKDCCIDVSILGMGWEEAQTFLRRHGWAAWWRRPWQGFSDHIHMVSLGCPTCPVGEYVPGQISDYYNNAYGLEGMHSPGSDPSWFPVHIGDTIFNFTDWEDDMGYNDWSQADRNALREDLRADMKTVVREALAQLPATTASVVWNFLVRSEPKLNARAALRKAAEED